MTGPEPEYLATLRGGVADLAAAHLSVNEDPAELTVQIIKLAERTLENIRAKNPPALPLACAKGCAACCHLRVGLTAPEVLLIVRHLRPFLHELGGRIRRHALELATLELDDYFLTPMPCPFLIENMCGIYPVRPLMCRRANSVDADRCHQTIFGRISGEITSYAHQADIFRHASLGLTIGIAKAGLDGTVLELTQAVAAALADVTIEARWRAGAPAFVDAGAKLETF